MKKNKAKGLSDADFKNIYSRVPRLCVDLVIKDRRGIVLALRSIDPWKNLWHMPGGTVFFGESLNNAAKRIAFEETGLKIQVVEQIGLMEFTEEIAMIGRHSVSAVLFCKPNGGKLRGSWRGKNVGFFKILPKPMIAKHAKMALKFL